MQEKVIYIDAVKLIQYETLMKGSIDYEANGLKSYQTVDSWTVNFEDGIHSAMVALHSGNRLLNTPLWVDVTLLVNGCELGHTEAADKLCGIYALFDGEEMFCIEVTSDLTCAKGLSLIRLADRKLLMKMTLEASEDIDLDSNGEVNYYVPVYFDPDTAFEGLPGRVSTEENDDWVNVYVCWNSHNNAVGMLVTYDWATGNSDTFLVALDTEEQMILRDWLFRTAKEVYSMTPEEAYEVYEEYGEHDD